MRCAFDRVVLVDVLHDLVDLLLLVSQALEGGGNGLIDDLQHAAPDQLLVLDQGDVGLDPRGVAIHHESDRARRSEHGNLRVAVAELLSLGVGLVPHARGRISQIGGERAGVDSIRGAPMLVDHAQERLFVQSVAGERAELLGDARRLRVRLAGENGCHRGGVVAPLV